MTELHIADLSKYQRDVDLARVGPAVILRAHSGVSASGDPLFKQRFTSARQRGLVIGVYGYVVANRDAAEQGREFAAIVGRLRAGEFAVCDLESGEGDQSKRAEAWCKAVDDACGGRAWLYCGLSFYTEHHLDRVKDRHLWVAAYRDTEPTSPPHALWQHTDHERHAGVGTPCDCSVFRGTVAELRQLINPSAPAVHRTPPPQTSTKGPLEMVVVYAPDRATALLSGGRLLALDSNAEKDAMAAAGVPVKRLTAAQYDALDAVSHRVAG